MKQFSVRIGAILLAGVASFMATLSSGTPAAPAVEKFLELEWDDLLPAKERAALSDAMPPQHDYLGEEGPPAMQSGSAAVNASLNNTKVKIPGFIVPLKMQADQSIEEFFLVPYFGACIHTPPPPPNQIVFVKLARKIPMDSMYTPVWVSGTLKTQSKGTRLGASAYSLDGVKVEPYTE
jgi:hypothetical protein